MTRTITSVRTSPGFASVGKVEKEDHMLKVSIRDLEPLFILTRDAARLIDQGAAVPIVSIKETDLETVTITRAMAYRSKSGKAICINHPQRFCCITRKALEDLWYGTAKAARISAPITPPIQTAKPAPACSSIYSRP